MICNKKSSSAGGAFLLEVMVKSRDIQPAEPPANHTYSLFTIPYYFNVRRPLGYLFFSIPPLALPKPVMAPHTLTAV
jgi:hypothetical protein